MQTASVFVNIPVKSIAQAFTYRVPAELSHLSAGWRVFVPFGGRKVEGFILSVQEQDEAKMDAGLLKKLKDIQGAVDEEAWFTPEMIRAARELSDFYLCSLAEIMRLFMPGKSGLKISVAYEAAAEQGGHMMLAMPQYRAVYDYLLQEGAHKAAELRHALPDAAEQLPDILERLTHYGVLHRVYLATKRDAARYEKILVVTHPIVQTDVDGLKRKKGQQQLLAYLMEQGTNIPLTLSFSKLKESGFSAMVIQSLSESVPQLVAIRQRRVLRDSYGDVQAAPPKAITLTKAQEHAIQAVEPSLSAREYHGFLLQGVTGSGKTQVYIELAKRVRAAGHQVIVLVPEIALTGQVVMAFKSYFPEDIVVMHSQLSLQERNDAILRVRRGEAGIIIGARSALFTPAADIGLIILDEEQDASYKQDESPRYHAKVVAETLAHIHKSVLVYGSATPSMESAWRAAQGELTLLRLPERIGNMPLPDVTCVDMRQELRCGNRHIISRLMKALIEKTIARNQQIIIMLNRRGYSTFVMCRSCGAVITCPDCGMPMVYHTSAHGSRLQCHHCDTRRDVPDVCPKCGSRYIKYFGSGTEKLEQELCKVVPKARIIRMDRDTTTTKLAHQQILERFRRHEFDILLGTQMVAKGHDIPNVTAVGVISADSSLHMPDFRAAERCFMLITQTAGRAGRGDIPGHVVIQTYNPEHYAVQCGIRQDYRGFYAQELKFRQELFFPPYSRLIKMLFQDKDATVAKGRAMTLVQAFQKAFSGNKSQQIIGPAPAAIAKFRDTYRFVVLIKTGNLAAVRTFLRESGMHLRTDVAIDIDPLTML